MEERTANYPGYRDESTMKVIRHESLDIYIYAKPKNQMEQKYNLNLTARAEAIRCRRFEAIVNERYDFFDKEKMKGDFLAYFKKLADKEHLSQDDVIRLASTPCSAPALKRAFLFYCLTALRKSDIKKLT